MENEKRTNKGLIVAIVIILLLAIVGSVFYFVKISSPKYIFTTKINSILVESDSRPNKEYEKFNTTLSLSGNIETTNSEYKQIANIVNNGKIKINIQADLEAKKALLGANVDYKNQELLQANAFYQDGDQNVYFYIKDLFDKYFKIDMSKSTDEYDINALFDINSSNSENINKKISDKIIKDTISKNLKDEYFSKETLDGMTKNTMKVTIAELRNIYTNVVTSLKDNEKYLNCFKDPEKLKESYEKTLEAIHEFDNKYDTYSIEISIFTKGFLNKAKKVEIRVIISENEEAKFVINEIDKMNYDFSLDIKSEEKEMPITAEALKGTIKIEDKGDETKAISVVVENIPDVGKVSINLEVSISQDTDIENVNVLNSVDINNLSQSDMLKLYTNLTKMKAYPLIAPYLGF